MTALHGGRLDQLEVYPNLWAGIGLVRGGAGTALVGRYDQVADRIAEYHAAGFDEFILSGGRTRTRPGASAPRWFRSCARSGSPECGDMTLHLASEIDGDGAPAGVAAHRRARRAPPRAPNVCASRPDGLSGPDTSRVCLPTSRVVGRRHPI